MSEWTLHHQPYDCRADHEYSFWIDEQIVVMANPIPGHKDKIEFMLKAVSSHDALVKALTDLCDEIGCEEQHGDGAHDESCQTCRAHQRARDILGVVGQPRPHGETP